MCLLHSLAEGICLCMLDQINADLKGNWYQLAIKKINKLYVGQILTLKRGRQEVWRFEEEVDKDAVC